MPDTFLDNLARINSQNYLGGLTNAAKAIEGEKQNQALYDLYNEFRTKQSGLDTTDKQLSDFSTTATDTLKNIPMSPEIKAQMDMMKVVDQMGANVNLYQPYITAFAALGEDGVRLANSLSNQLGTKLELLEKKGEIPYKAMQQANMAEQYSFNVDQHTEFNRKVQVEKDLGSVTDYLLDSISDWETPDLTTSKGLSQFEAMKNSFIENAAKEFGGKVEKGVIAQAFSEALKLSGKTEVFDMQYKNENLKINKEQLNLERQRIGLEAERLRAAQLQAQGLNVEQLQSYASNLRAWSAQYNNYSNDFKNALSKYMSSGQLPSKDNATIGEGIDPEAIKAAAEIYAPGGKYLQYYSTLNVATQGGYSKMQKQGKLDVPANRDAIDVIIPYGENAFAKQQYKYNPYQVKKLVEANTQTINKMMEESNFNEGGTTSLYNTVYDLFPNVTKGLETIMTNAVYNKSDDAERAQKLLEERRK